MESISKNILFIAYYYPPAGGAALPGSQRTVKFIRYISKNKANVLSLNTENYREYIDRNFSIDLPVRSEEIFRTTNFDIFSVLLNIRSFFKEMISKKETDKENIKKSSRTKSQKVKESRSLFQAIKDFVYDVIYFPDDAAPWLFPAVWNGRKIIKKANIDVIFATGMPWTSLIVGYALHKLSGKSLVVDFRDPWVGNPFHVSKGRIFDNLMTFLERKIVTAASLVSANTKPLQEDFLSRYPHLDANKFIVLPNGFDPGDFSEIDSATVPRDKLYFAHAGSLYGRRDPSPLLLALRSLMQSEPDIAMYCHFTQMGYIETDYAFGENYSDLTDTDTIEDAGLFSYDECLHKLAQSDVAVLIQPATKIQIPSKIYDYMALNKYILAITPLDGVLAKMMHEYQLGDVFDPQDIVGISNRIKTLCLEKMECGRIGTQYRNVEEFDVRNITAHLEELLLKAAS